MWLRLTNLHATVARRTDAERTWLQDYLTFNDARAHFKRGGGSDKVTLFNVLAESFPAGLAALVRRAAAQEGIEVQEFDNRHKPSFKPTCDEDDLDWLRDYQREAVERIVSRARGIIWIPTAGGKTEIAIGASLVLPVRWLFLVHRTNLVDQTADRYEQRTGLKAGRIGESVWDAPGWDGLPCREPVQFVAATFQSVAAALRSTNLRHADRARELLGSAEGLVVDECFPAGTLVGVRPIEEVRVGDMVPSYDREAGFFCYKRVAGLHTNRAHGLVRLHFADGRTVVCTHGHPFLTDHGWVPAYSLCGQDVIDCGHEVNPMRTMRCDASPHDNASQPTVLLPTLPEGALEGTPQDGDRAVCMVQHDAGIGRAAGSRTRKATQDLLRRGMQEQSPGRILVEVSNVTGGGVLETYEGQQPITPARGSRQDLGNTTAHRSQATLGGRKGAGHDGSPATPTGDAVGCTGRLGGQVLDHHGESGPAPLHLPRPGAPREQDGGGSGRRQPRPAQDTGSGRTQGGVPARVRVDRVEVLEPGSDGTYGGLCPQGLVYNLEVEGTHAYLVEGGLVAHNCHTLPADSFWRVAMLTPKAFYRVGLSGTPLARGDRRSLLGIAALGEVIYRVRAQKLIDDGVVSRPKIRLLEVKQAPQSPTWAGVYKNAIVKSTLRNRAVLEMAERCAKPAFVFVNHTSHGRALEKLLWKHGIRAAFVWGNSSMDNRKRVVRDLAADRLDVIVCSVVFQEGIDVPELRGVVVASAGMSVIATLQRLGRGMRIEKDAAGTVIKNTFEVWDVADVGCGCAVDSVEGKHAGCKWLEKHARARISAYTSEGYETVVEPYLRV